MQDESNPFRGPGGEKIRRALGAVMEIPPDARWQILRGGRSNDLWRVRGGGRDIVIKIAAGGASGNPLFPNLPESEYEAMRRLAPLGLAPEPVAFVPSPPRSILAYRHVEGFPGRASPAEAAMTLRRVHCLDAGGWPFRILPSGSAAIAAQTRAILAGCPPVQARALRALAPVGHVRPISREVLLHGDPVPANLIAGRGGVTPIDWQCPAVGDPCEDIAIHLSPAMQALYGRRPLRPRERRAFLAAYGDAEITSRYQRLAPFFHWRMAAYCLWKSARGASEYGSAMKLEIGMLRRIRA